MSSVSRFLRRYAFKNLCVPVFETWPRTLYKKVKMPTWSQSEKDNRKSVTVVHDYWTNFNYSRAKYGKYEILGKSVLIGLVEPPYGYWKFQTNLTADDFDAMSLVEKNIFMYQMYKHYRKAYDADQYSGSTN